MKTKFNQNTTGTHFDDYMHIFCILDEDTDGTSPTVKVLHLVIFTSILFLYLLYLKYSIFTKHFYQKISINTPEIF